MRPKDFWALHPREFWWIAEAKQSQRRIGSLSEHEMGELHEELVSMGVLKNG